MKHNTLRLLCALLALMLMMLPLAACGQQTNKQESTAAITTAAETSAGTTAVTTTQTTQTGAATTQADGETGTRATTVPETTAVTTKPAATTQAATTKPAGTVSLTVQCHKAVEYIQQNNIKGYDRIVPANGIMLAEKNIPLQNGDSVLSVLKRVLDAHSMIYKADGGYVSNIGGLAAKAKAFGEQSGWLYSVNGVTPPNVSSAAYILKAGDVIEFRFVTEYTPF